MFEIRMIITSRGTSHLKCGTLGEAQRSAREAAAITGCQVEILDSRTGEVVERCEPPTTTRGISVAAD